MANQADDWRRHSVELPPAFERYYKIGGALLFAAFADVEGDEEAAAAAICSVVPDTNPTILRALGSRRIDDKTFFGEGKPRMSVRPTFSRGMT